MDGLPAIGKPPVQVTPSAADTGRRPREMARQSAPVAKAHETKEPWNQGIKVSSKQGTLEASNLATKEPRNQGFQRSQPEEAAPFDINNSRPYRNDTFAFTTEELEAVEDLKLELRRRLDLKATKNDIVRCAIHTLVEDHRRSGTNSIIVRRLSRKHAR